jgi:hypothetical protein
MDGKGKVYAKSDGFMNMASHIHQKPANTGIIEIETGSSYRSCEMKIV